MKRQVWHLDELTASLQLKRLTAKLDLSKPLDGLGHLQLDKESLGNAKLLQIGPWTTSCSTSISPDDFYVRFADLVATYGPTEAQPVRVQVYWRAFEPSPSDKTIAIIELIVSVQTDLLDCDPKLSARCSLSADEVIQLVGEANADFRPLAPIPGQSIRVEPGQSASCIVFRLPGGRFSFAEMVHPFDFHQGELSFSREGSERVTWIREIFSERLEKGVIRRARIRGVFLPRQNDTTLAARYYWEFATAEPILTT